MKTQLRYAYALFILVIFNINAHAQAPNIYYSPLTNIYTIGSAITPLSPANVGGVVPSSPGYGYVGTLVNSGLGTPTNLVYDGNGHLYTTDRSGYIKMIDTATKVVTIIAGTGAATESDNAIGTLATFNNPIGIAYDGTGYLYVADYAGEVIRKVSTTAPYPVVTIAGNSTNAHADGTGTTTAEFNGPRGIIYDAASNCLFVCDYGATNTGALRKIDLSTSPATVSTIASSISSPYGLAYNGADFYMTYRIGFNILKISGTSPFTTSTFAGDGTGSELDGTGTAAQFNAPAGISYDRSGYLYVSDFNGHTVRRVSIPGAVVTTIAGTAGTPGTADGLGPAASFTAPYGFANDGAGTLYVADRTAGSIRKINVTGYTISPNLPAGLSIDPGTGIITGTPAAASPAISYTVTAYNASGSSSATIIIGCGQDYDWTAGAGTTAWLTPGNWSPAGPPSSADNVRIGVSSTVFTQQPAISTNVTVGSITFGSTVQPAISIANAGSLTVNNNFTVNTGAAPVITGTGTAAVNMAPGSIVNINGTGTLTLNSPLAFTLQSNANADAAIGPLASSSTINGTAVNAINVQRYLSSNRGYRLLSSPVYAGAVTSGSNTFNNYQINYLKDSTFIQGTNPAGGFNRTGNPTLYIYRESLTPTYNSFTNSCFRGINDLTGAPGYMLDIDNGPYNIPVGNGYLFYFIGGLATANPWVPGSTTPATLTTNGTLNTGQINTTHWYTPGGTGLSFTTSSPTGVKGNNLVGNPYPSAIDWDTFQTTSTSTGIYGSNVDPVIYVLDPVTQNYGAYIAGFGGVGSASFVSNIISSGQGFFVTADTTNAQLIFNESAKTAAYNPPSRSVMDIPRTNLAKNSSMDTPAVAAKNSLATAPTNNTALQYLRLGIGQDGASSDETLVRFSNGATLAYNRKEDALYKSGYGSVNLATSVNNHVSLAINSVPLPTQAGDTVKLNVTAARDGIYQLTLTDMVNVPQLYDIWLKDAYKKDSLDIRRYKTYNFNIYKADSTSFGGKRFSLIIRQNPQHAYRLINFVASALLATHQVQIMWQTNNDGDDMNFTVEHSVDGGKTFSALGSMQGTNAGTYNMPDKNPITGLNFYRLKQESINTTAAYSKVVSVQFFGINNDIGKNGINVYPNPAKSTVNLTINTPAKPAVYNIKFINSWGNIKKEFTSAQPTWHGNVSGLEAGVYIIQISDDANSNFVGQTKFIKR